jgi:hypothetical protein
VPSVTCKVVGVTHVEAYPQNMWRWAQLPADRYPKCRLVRQPDNKADPNAIRVKVGRGFVGFVPAELAARVAEVMDSGVDVTAVITSVEVIPDLANNPSMTIRITRP